MSNELVALSATTRDVVVPEKTPAAMATGESEVLARPVEVKTPEPLLISVDTYPPDMATAMSLVVPPCSGMATSETTLSTVNELQLTPFTITAQYGAPEKLLLPWLSRTSTSLVVWLV